MAVVLTSEESSYFAPAALRRSHSQPKFASRQPSAIHSSSSASRIHDHYSQPVKIFADSAPSTAPSSPRTLQPSAADLSCSSTPASNLSFSTDSESNGDSLLQDLDDENDIFFPAYNGYLDTSTPEELEPPPSPRAGSSPGNGTSTGSTSNSRTPDVYEPGAVDDTAVGIQPTRHVDYLSHDWKEEDIWSSWKHIVSNREEFGNSARLENASWRTWIKAKNHLKTISPETLNWLKDCDVTWLYGPLLPGKQSFSSVSSAPDAQATSSAGLSKSNSFIDSQSKKKKPILKKRSMSEVMLQKSLSSSSLIKQAAAAVQAQQKAMPKGIRVMARPRFERAATDYVTFPLSSRRMSREQLSIGPSSSTSGVISPSSERKHIHFNEQVEQCIAVDVKGDDDDDDLESDRFNFDSDSDDGIMMMRTATRKRRPILKRRTSSHDKKKKSINLLPPTTLKYREDTPEPTETAMKHSYRSPVMSPSSSQETLRPSKSSAKKMFFVDDDDEEEDDDVCNDGESDDGLRSPPPGGFSSSGFHRTPSASNLNAAPSGMRRTESGMFMPYEEGESASEGIFGFVLDTVNTARDIAHVVWNVGWRR